MKKWWIALAVFRFLSPALAQHSVVSADKMNVAYIGVPNPISVAVTGYDCSSLIVTADGADVTPLDECRYDLVPRTPGSVVVKVSVKKDGKTLLVGEHKLRVKYIPDPVAKVGGKSGGKMQVAVFKAQTGIVAYYGNFDYDARCQVHGYSVTVIRKGNVLFEHKVAGGKFDEVTRENFQKLIAGDIVMFTEIKAQGPDRLVRTVNNIELTLI